MDKFKKIDEIIALKQCMKVYELSKENITSIVDEFDTGAHDELIELRIVSNDLGKKTIFVPVVKLLDMLGESIIYYNSKLDQTQREMFSLVK